MKTITQLLKAPLSENILKARIEKDNKARDEFIAAVQVKECHPEGAWRAVERQDEDPATWISASGITDAFLHRLACKCMTKGVENIYEELNQQYDGITAEFIQSLVTLAYRTGDVLFDLMGGYLDPALKLPARRVYMKETRHVNSFLDKPLTDLFHNRSEAEYSSNGIANSLIKYWTAHLPPYKQQRYVYRFPLTRLPEANSSVISPHFCQEIEYNVKNLKPLIEKLSPEGGLHFDSLYGNKESVSLLQTKLEKFKSLGIVGLFRELYNMTKGYSHPLCRSCLYSPTTKTFWYALRPIFLEGVDDEGCEVEHTFSDIWVRWDPSKFTDSITTYSDNAIKVFRIGDLTGESAAGSHVHPHVSSEGNICLGSGANLFNLANDTFSLSASMDILIGILNEYVGGDAFSALKRFTMTRCSWDIEYGHEDNDRANYCQTCGDEVDEDEDVHSEYSSGWYHSDCCTFSEYHDSYIGIDNDVWSDIVDSPIDATAAIHLAAESQVAGWVPEDLPEIYQLWIPESRETRRASAPDVTETVLNMGLRVNDAYNNDAYGCLIYLYTTDIQEDLAKACPRYVELSETLYRQVTQWHPNLDRRNGFIWGKLDDCIDINTSDDPNSHQYVLKLHHDKNLFNEVKETQ